MKLAGTKRQPGTGGMNSYLSLVPISAKVRRRQNRLTLLCIILSVFLVTALFSMADIMVKGEDEAMRRRHGEWHIALSGLTEPDASEIAAREDVSSSAWFGQIDYGAERVYTIRGKSAILYGTETPYVTEIRKYGTEGSFPQDGAGVMLSADAKARLNVAPGDSVSLATPAGEREYIISGFCADDSEYNDTIDGVCVYMPLPELESIRAENREDGGNSFYIRFAKKADIRKRIAELKERYGGGNVRENTAILGLSGASSNQNINAMYPLAAALFLLVLAAGVLMISSCMNSSVAQRTRFFGMLRCVGASKKQVMRIVRLEALNWCKTAVPAGCVLGVAASWLITVILQQLSGSEFADFRFRFSPLSIVCGAAVGVVTVLLAARSPAKRAAGVSPVAAVSGGTEAKRHAPGAADTRFFKIETALGIHHAVAEKKNFVQMTLSFALTIVLFFSFSALFDFARKLVPSMSSFTPDIAISSVSTDDGNTIDRSLKEKMRAIPGVEAVFCNAFALGTPARFNGAEGSVDLISYDEFMVNWSKKSVASGDISMVSGDCNYAMTIFNKNSRLHTGDRVQIGSTELEIACVLTEGIWGDVNAVVICTEETFRRLTGEENYILLNANLGRDASAETVRAIQALADGYVFSDRRGEKTQNRTSFWVFRAGSYGFLAIISLITVLNIMNSISMSVSAKIKQYGAMRAVGMSTRQLTRMIASEASAYAACGLIAGSSAGLFLHRLLTMRLIVHYFGGVWKLPVEPIACIVPIVVLSCAAAVHTPAKRLREMQITETINEL